MHEWLEALRKSVKASSAGVSPEEIRRAETECGVPFPDELTDLYQAFNGGELNGEVLLFRLHGAEADPSVMEKTRLKLEGLPAAGLWRIGLKGQHRHLFASRKSAMVEQGDGGGPLPAWVEALEGDDWLYGTWEGEKRQMRLYRSLKDMLDVLVPPAEVESFGERTFARAMNAVLQGALSGVQVDEEEDAAEAGEAPPGAAAEAEAVEEAEQLEEAELADEEAAEVEEPEVRELAYEYDDVRSSSRHEDGAGPKKARAQAQQIPLAIGGAGVLFPKSASSKVQGVKKAAAEPASAKTRPAKKTATGVASADLLAGTGEAAAGPEAAPKKAATKKAGTAKAAQQAATKQLVAAKSVTEDSTQKGAPKKSGTAKATTEAAARKSATKKSATSKAATKAPVQKASAKKAATSKAPAQKVAAKKSATSKSAKKSAVQKGAAKKAVTAKAPVQKGAAKKVPAQKGGAKRAGAPKGAAKKAAAPTRAAKKSSVKKAAAQKSGAKKTAASKKGSAKKPATKKAARGR
ncbi:histone H1-like repetitive region-containing protein [Myxococcus sp. SDU36]|uniref:SMI1/KNR4 family protein n=1 Tax=Myxococcus sp. SDU36 TaxID=2831967 RepID=UPI002542F4EE|nr:histone H1-like repetitive region-containing protein [Myxococcus sp. SDU36]WIG93566.1 histone H1-like repetitive region-containing protein [Myxococcus sp. SDU36]